MKLEYPLIDVLPSIEHARDRLLARIFRYRQDQEASRLSTDEDYALIYAYSMFPCLLILVNSYMLTTCSSGDRPVVDRDSGSHWGNRPAVWDAQ